jgi:hypothetical protein
LGYAFPGHAKGLKFGALPIEAQAFRVSCKNSGRDIGGISWKILRTYETSDVTLCI